MKIVEMLGVPGSGKSTIAAGLRTALPESLTLEEAVRISIERHGQDGMARMVARISRSPDSRMWKAAYGRSSDRFSGLERFIAGHRALAVTVLGAQQARSERDLGQDLVLGWALNLMARYQLATESSHQGWLIVDEGFLQRGVAIFGHGFDDADREWLDTYLGHIPMPDAVVVVDAPAEIVESRLDTRGWSERLAHVDKAGRSAFLADTRLVVETARATAKRAGAQVVSVDGSNPAQGSYESITATLTA